MLLWASELGTAKIECSFEMGKWKPSAVPTIYFAVEDTQELLLWMKIL